ncbi:DUF599 domain-containing protein [Cypionkella psychrotolerans]|uniref:DUF599 domain-containing protein n=1 Tax=Cypionkella psychrotolerans TaxID=1678131 RepID=UPI001F34AB78|nr:DUF599 domain-containing protein [Cypionkella psychrotolerans]
MQSMISLGPFSTIDALSVALALIAWAGIGWLIEHPPASRPSVTVLMKEYRREWMRQFLTRQPRIFDASMIDSLRQGTAFFASASLIAIGGGIALIGNPAAIVGLAEDLTLPADATGLQLRVLLVIVFLANAVLKFIWSNRLFGYCAIMMAAVPNDPSDPAASHRAQQAAELNITAAKSFNRGLHSIYFALGSLGWLLGPYPLIATTLLTSAMLIRREFASESRKVMLRGA